MKFRHCSPVLKMIPERRVVAETRARVDTGGQPLDHVMSMTSGSPVLSE